MPSYFCDAEELPCPLPTSAEIKASTESLPCVADPLRKRVVRVKDRFVVKYGIWPWVTENEGHALLVLSQYSGIPTPRLYAMYSEGDIIFIVMEFKEGNRLSELWKDMPEDDKQAIVCQLKHIFTEVRNIPSPGIFGSANGSQLEHRFFLSSQKDPAVTGPFREEKEFAMAMALRAKKIWEGTRYRGWHSEFLARHLPTVLSGHTSVFTHADLQRKNILISKHISEDGKTSSLHVSAILDWEDSGWYPNYWEYAGNFIDFAWNDDWPEKFESIVEPCPVEAGLLMIVKRDIEH
ncbi:kinase-like domain-containing protein [Xylaria sp. FL1777]|nr:kinase-like domain-containing protein [Xylaria sp. FL1777]